MLKIHEELLQGSDEWHAARLGLLTASEMKHIITPAKLAYAQNDKERSHLYELLAQRITGWVEPFYISDDMLRGQVDEIDARAVYAAKYAPFVEAGFITNDKWGFTLGYSPDGLVGTDGLIECKSRRAKYQIETILANEMPGDYLIQVQTGLLVSERKWCDFITYSAGLPMMTHRVYADPVVQEAIVKAAAHFHSKLDAMLVTYNDRLKDATMRLIPTERRAHEQEMEMTA
jgi:hypothetical protein